MIGAGALMLGGGERFPRCKLPRLVHTRRLLKVRLAINMICEDHKDTEFPLPVLGLMVSRKIALLTP